MSSLVRPVEESSLLMLERRLLFSVGAIGSLVLLQLSGDPAVLSQPDIPSVVNLPTVGKNLQDQSLMGQGTKGMNFDVGGSGSSDVIAFLDIYQVSLH